jgi:membrane associated rhomboid family serine protease
MKSSNYQVQMIVSLTPMVKALLVINAVIWLLGVVIAQGFILKNTIIFDIFGLSGTGVLENFQLWQPLTYMFLHSESIWHILFNGLIIWFVGSELEKIWGPREFLRYYLTCGVGAGFLYIFVVSVAVNIFGLNEGFLSVPTIGASGAVFGLLMAYGLIFGERVIYFMMLFPMKAKFFILILAVVEVFTLVTSGFGGAVNNTAHLGGFLVGLLYIYAGKFKMKRMQRKWLKKPGHKLKLVVDNEKKDDKPTFH